MSKSSSKQGSSLNKILSTGKIRTTRNRRKTISFNRRESLTDNTARREKALEKSFWDGVFGIVGIRNHSEIEFADIEKSSNESETPEQATKKLVESGLINPSGYRKTIWDMLCGSSIMYSIIVVPFSIGFAADINPGLEDFSLDIVVDAVFLMDILVTFQMPFYCRKTNVFVIDRLEIAKNYCSFWFWVDLIASVPLEEIAKSVVANSSTTGTHIRSIKLLRIFRLTRLAKLFRLLKSQRLKDFLEKSHISPAIMSVLVLLFQIFLVAHIIGCFWFFISTDAVTGYTSSADPQIPNTLTWAAVFGCDQSDVSSQYIISLFWTFQTLLTVGYGDVHPVNSTERAYAFIVMLLGGLMFGSIIAKVGEMVESRNLQAKESRLMMEEFVVLLDKHHMPLQLKTAAKDAYSYFLKCRPSVAQSGFWDTLPLQLRLKLVNDRFYREIQAIHLFRNSDIAFVSELIVHSKPYIVLAGELVYDIGDIADEISFILQGSVRITVPGYHDVLVGCGTVGGFIGDLEFFKNSIRTARYVAVHDCILLGVDFSYFSAAVEDHPDAGARFMSKVERRYTQFQVVRNAPCWGHSDSVDMMRRMSAVSQGGKKGSTSTRKSSRRSSSAIVFNNIFAGKEATRSTVPQDFVVGSRLWNDGELVEAKNADDIQASLFSKTTSTIRYRVLMLDEENKEFTREMTINFLGSYGFVHPRDVRKNRWDIFMAIVITYSVLTIPVQLAFTSYLAEETEYSASSVDFTIDFLFLVDIILNFNMVYFSDPDAAFVAVRWRIMQQYVRSWFLVDLLSFFPFGEFIALIIDTHNISASNLTTIQLVKSIRLVRLIKVFQAVDISRILRRLEDNFNINPAVLSLALTILQVLLISHMVCCMWWGLSAALTVDNWYNNPDMVYYPLGNASFHDQYIASLYWTVTTLTTVGYGDIVPQNDQERILAIFIMVVGASVFGYVTANVAALVTGSSLMEVLAAGRLNIVKEFLRDCKCNSHLTAEIVSHVKQASKVHNSIDEAVAYARLPTRIRNNLLINSNRVILSRIPFFSHIKNTSIKLYLLSLMTLKVGASGRCLIKDGKSGCEIFFLVEGDAAIYQMLESSATSKQREKESVVVPKIKKERRAPDFMMQFGNNLRQLQRKSMKTGGEEMKIEVPASKTETAPSLKRHPSTSPVDIKRPRRRSALHSMSTRKRLQAQSNWARVKVLIPVIADIGRKAKEDEKQANARLIQLGALRPGDFIGHREIMRGEKHAYTVIASTPCKYYTLHRNAVTKLLSDHPDIALQLQTALGYSIYDEGEATVEKISRREKQSFLRSLREQHIMAKNNALKAKSLKPMALSSAVRMLYTVSRNFIGTGGDRGTVIGGDRSSVRVSTALTLGGDPRSSQRLDSIKFESQIEFSKLQTKKSSSFGLGGLSELVVCGAQRGPVSVSDPAFNRNFATSDTGEGAIRPRPSAPSTAPLTDLAQKRHWSYSNLLDSSREMIAQERFLLKEVPASLRMQRRQSFPSDNSQHTHSRALSRLDNTDYMLANAKFTGNGGGYK